MVWRFDYVPGTQVPRKFVYYSRPVWVPRAPSSCWNDVNQGSACVAAPRCSSVTRASYHPLSRNLLAMARTRPIASLGPRMKSTIQYTPAVRITSRQSLVHAGSE